jgi:hypothetical protein
LPSEVKVSGMPSSLQEKSPGFDFDV